MSNPSLFPDPTEVISFSEPVILATIITPGEYLGPIMDLCKTKRGEQVFSSEIYLGKSALFSNT